MKGKRGASGASEGNVPASKKRLRRGESRTADADLRRQAEDRLAERLADGGRSSPGDTERMLHELRVHQIELETQNEELRRTQAELDASRARYFDLYDLAPVGYVTLSETGLILEANLAAARLLGVARSRLVRRPLTRSILPEDQDVYYRHRQALLGTGTPQVCELRMLRAEVAPFWARVESAAAAAADGAPQCRAMVIDISESRKTEEERIALLAALQEQQRLASIGTMARGMAHEINNPLNGILNYAQLIKDRTAAGLPVTEFADAIIAETARVAAITHGLLDFSRRGETQEFVSVALADVVASALRLAGGAVREQGIVLSCDVSSDLPMVSCHPGQVGQVVMALLTNAMEALDEKGAAGEGSRVIRVTARRFREAGGSWLRVTVEDNGSGIPEGVRSRVFDPFFSTKDRARHAGIGLSVSHGIVRAHGGRLSVESEPGRSTRFHVDLPAEEPGAGEAGPGAPALPEESCHD